MVAIVNRRNSDLVDKSDGVLYTSDGRDVEMAVPSTKAFYAQIAAGYLLAIAIADELGSSPENAPDAGAVHEILDALRALPDAMTKVLALQTSIAGIAQRHAVSRRYWAVVGNGRNRIAARRGAGEGLGALLQVDLVRLAPRTRSTSTSRPSRWCWCARRDCRAPTPTTWPRRSPSTGRTGPRRS